MPRRCAQLTAPDNGKIVSKIADFQFPTVVEFQCKFGYQMHGSRFLKCQSDGTWNGTVPTCIRKLNILVQLIFEHLAAVCEGIQNNTSIGMFVAPSLPYVAYGDNVTISCTQQNRPGKYFQIYHLANFQPESHHLVAFDNAFTIRTQIIPIIGCLGLRLIVL